MRILSARPFPAIELLNKLEKRGHRAEAAAKALEYVQELVRGFCPLCLKFPQSRAARVARRDLNLRFFIAGSPKRRRIC